MTPYIVEFVNTLSNITYSNTQSNDCESDANADNRIVIFAYHGMRRSWRDKSVSNLTCLPYLGLFAVGIGSGLFHASLQRSPQICGYILL